MNIHGSLQLMYHRKRAVAGVDFVMQCRKSSGFPCIRVASSNDCKQKKKRSVVDYLVYTKLDANMYQNVDE